MNARVKMPPQKKNGQGRRRRKGPKKSKKLKRRISRRKARKPKRRVPDYESDSVDSEVKFK